MMNAMKSNQKHNYYPSSPLQSIRHLSASYYSVPNWIVANRWMLFQAWWN